jgi:hypothetical protein
VDALKDEFYTTFFGPEAGPHVRAWWDACQRAMRASTSHAHEDWVAVRHIYTVPFTKKIRPHVDAALAAEATPRQRERLDAFALIADHLEAYAAMIEAQSRLDYAAALEASNRMLENVDKLNNIYSRFAMDNPRKAQRRTAKLKKVAAKLDGAEGDLVAPLPLEMKFTRDPHNEGIVAKWYAPAFDDSGWGSKNTFLTWDQQDPPVDEKGHDYDGYGWYRADIDVDQRWTGEPLNLYLGGVINEAWVWVNGQYAGHKDHKLWWSGPHAVDLDVTDMIRPGRGNTVAVRILNDAEIGGMYERGFLYSPKPQQQ